MRDVQFLSLDETYELVIAVDNIGGVGLKENDIVNVDYETVGHFGMRVAMLECLATGAQPLSAMIHNFCGDEAWQPLVSGVKQTLRELGIEHISITGSTESNFSLIQSAVGFLAIGKVKKNEKKIAKTPLSAKWAVIGLPLVGADVLKRRDQMAPLSLLQPLIQTEGVYEILPVGSKGIGYEAKMLANMNGMEIKDIQTELDLYASAGPATCWIVTYDPSYESTIRSIAKNWFHPLVVNINHRQSLP